MPPAVEFIELLPLPRGLDSRSLRRRALQIAVVLGTVGAVAVLAPGLGDVRRRLEGAQPGWLGVAVVLELLSCLSYVLMFRPIFCARMSQRTSYQLAMSELAVGSLVPASGTAGLAFGAWALRKGGMPAHDIARRTVAFFVLKSAVNFSPWWSSESRCGWESGRRCSGSRSARSSHRRSRPRHPALTRRRRDRTRRPYARPPARACWCPPRRDRRSDDPRHREPRPRNGPARALTPEVTPGPAVMRCGPGCSPARDGTDPKLPNAMCGCHSTVHEPWNRAHLIPLARAQMRAGELRDEDGYGFVVRARMNA